jgi:hypothetical protein
MLVLVLALVTTMLSHHPTPIMYVCRIMMISTTSVLLMLRKSASKGNTTNKSNTSPNLHLCPPHQLLPDVASHHFLQEDVILRQTTSAVTLPM